MSSEVLTLIVILKTKTLVIMILDICIELPYGYAAEIHNDAKWLLNM